MGPKRFIFLVILILASLISASSAGGQRRVFNKYAVHVESMMKDSAKKVVHSKQAFVAHSRVLKANTNDYGNYDPSPSLSKPPFKLIPN
ncbi:protein CASPARIAN STRIP INTEGRITY FACTOR 1-like [Elaeis guineensis]|uniref:Protein CASPARIAN STRIP INTEGRITY FACTOR 1 n=1 Tax=Elaeis guineensis var. tenera TaxID=51953 RepID=A0A6I9SB60_ELAGV|nr:protein CASPARIAN STRIP INTEGRITY FACTOR 1 [Elaeis guineensis]